MSDGSVPALYALFSLQLAQNVFQPVRSFVYVEGCQLLTDGSAVAAEVPVAASM